jgi:hypothetical protein
LRERRTALSVHARDEDRSRICEILEELDPIDIDEEVATGMMTGVSRQAGLKDGTTASSPPVSGEGQEVIPVVREELQVGKRAEERRGRARACRRSCAGRRRAFPVVVVHCARRSLRGGSRA